ncbi:MAG: hypothetical protein V7607_2525 [Solirubrobacteraceae bacterium]
MHHLGTRYSPRPRALSTLVALALTGALVLAPTASARAYQNPGCNSKAYHGGQSRNRGTTRDFALSGTRRRSRSPDPGNHVLI